MTRLPLLALAHAIGRPMQWGLHRTPLAQPLYNRLGSAIDLEALRGGAFGDYQPSTGDVLACSYGKSGTNWCLQIVHQIAHRGAGEFDHIHDVVPWPDELGRGFSVPLDDPAPKQASPTGMRVIKTHLPWHCIPESDEARYVCVVRDPKDVAVSGYYFFRSVLLGPLMPPPDFWVEHFLTGRSLLGSWAVHLDGFWQQRHRRNVLFLRYEELKSDLHAAVDRIASLMGVCLTEEERGQVLTKSSFDYMRAIDHKFYPGMVSPLGLPDGKMMREGKSGAAGALLSETQRRRIDEVCRAALLKLGSDFPYEEVFCA